MKASWRRLLAGIVGGLTPLTLVGCQAPVWRAPIADVAPLRKDRREEALREFDQKRTGAQYEAALARRAEGDIAGSVTQLEDLLQRSPDHVLARLLLAEGLLDLGQSEAALVHVDEVLKAHPEEGRAQQLAAEIAGRLSGTQTSGPVAPAAYEQQAGVVDLVDGAASSALDDGRGHLNRGEVELARAAFQRAVDAAPTDSRVVISVATISLRAGQTALARDFLEAARAAFTDDARFFQTLGLVYYRRGETALAQVALRQALCLDNDAALAYFLMGSTLAKSGDTAGAARHFQEAALRDRSFADPALELLP